MNAGIQLILNNLGVGGEDLLVLVAVIGSFVFFAKDFKLGIMALLVSMAGLFVWFYETGADFSTAIIVFFMALVVMVLTLLTVNKTTQGGLA